MRMLQRRTTGVAAVFAAYLCSVIVLYGQAVPMKPKLRINNEGYFETRSLNVMVFDDFYPEGHQGGITIVQCGERVAANGDVRIDPTPGQWSPIPKIGPKSVDRNKGVISVELWYPDSSRDGKGFNPIRYPDLRFGYTVRVEALGTGFKISVDLARPLPPEWTNRVGFNLELFPGHLFGEHYLMDGRSGLFPRDADSPVLKDTDGTIQTAPLAVGKKFIAVPGQPGKELLIESERTDLQLLDGRSLYNNGWFILRSVIPAGATANAVVWIVTPSTIKNWTYRPVVQVSQVGYHPGQEKHAVIELDKSTEQFEQVRLVRIYGDSETVVKTDYTAVPWGVFLRYRYLRFDFSDITEPGIYQVRYGNVASNKFEIRSDIYSQHVWQPTLEYFLPVQMCHMKVLDRFRTWHGICHMDDAEMAPVNHIHFDGYHEGPSTLTKFSPGEHVSGLNVGGWHDAGDYDIRIESQAETVYKLALAYEFFGCTDDQTTIDEGTHTVILHKPDGIPDVLQQIEHGVLSILGGYESMGRLYRGIICSSMKQYVHLGDASTMTDNIVYRKAGKDPILGASLPDDDRWVFTEESPQHELGTAQSLAAAGRALSKLNPILSEKCLAVAGELFEKNKSERVRDRLNAAAELYLTTSKSEYGTLLRTNADTIAGAIMQFAEIAGRVAKKLDNPDFTRVVTGAVTRMFKQIQDDQSENPYGIPYKPYIWGAGWRIQSFGVKQVFLHLGFPNDFPARYAFNALNFVLGCHPGGNTASFASGIGVRSLTVAYGANRADWSYIPGGIASGTALISPDLPELKTWPYFWQQAEYVIGGGTVDYMILVMAADSLYNRRATY